MPNSVKDAKPFIVNVRWWDAYLETFHHVTDMRFGSDMLWLVMESGANRHIPLRQVRWFSSSRESHEVVA